MKKKEVRSENAIMLYYRVPSYGDNNLAIKQEAHSHVEDSISYKFTPLQPDLDNLSLTVIALTSEKQKFKMIMSVSLVALVKRDRRNSYVEMN